MHIPSNINRSDREAYQELCRRVKNGEDFYLDAFENGTAERRFTGNAPESWTEQEIAIYLDSGRVNFGGHVEKYQNGRFSAVIYVD